MPDEKNCIDCYWMKGQYEKPFNIFMASCIKGHLERIFKITKRSKPISWRKAETCSDFVSMDD